VGAAGAIKLFDTLPQTDGSIGDVIPESWSKTIGSRVLVFIGSAVREPDRAAGFQLLVGRQRRTTPRAGYRRHRGVS